MSGPAVSSRHPNRPGLFLHPSVSAASPKDLQSDRVGGKAKSGGRFQGVIARLRGSDTAAITKGGG